ncbi:hypothetical protein HK102_002388 [Quaeritorhiza haematococci]|nr:hypothetical protein HK102_002388 [Quaeritorhiza haematococci]
MAMRAASRCVRNATLAQRLVRPAAAMHTLTVPYVHTGVVPFEKGIPTEQIRELSPAEKRWDFWTTSDAFADMKPNFFGFKYIPYGEVWVMKSGKVAQSGVNFLVPGVDRIAAIKNTHPVIMGIVTPPVTTKDGSAVNAYAVVTLKVTDFVKSALYVDPETNRPDSEHAAAKVVRRVLEAEIPQISANTAGEVNAADQQKLVEKVMDALKARADEFGIEPVGVEIRGAYPTSENVPDKLRALDPPLPAEDVAGHNLSADYWSEVLSPPFFEKYKFGSRKEAKTPAAVSLEWAVPSPPDFHHFNQLPKMTVAPSAEKGVEKAH